MLALQWEYLLGKAFASQWESGRSAPEWPPHPDRVFQALVAAWGENGCHPAGASALRWVEALPPPGLMAPEGSFCSDHPVFVPTNDIESKQKKYNEPMLALLPEQRHKAERRFPAIVVSSPCALVWPDASPDADTRVALATLCSQVTHVGMATSLVRMWLSDDQPPLTLVPSNSASDMRLRVPHAGRLDALIAAYANGGAAWTRPPVARWIGYARTANNRASNLQSLLGDDWLVLCRAAGTRFCLAQAPAVAEALRATMIKAADGDSVAMPLISGHYANGAPLESPHVAYVPLGDVGHAHADGHVLGLAMVLPRALSYDERDAVMRSLANAQNIESGEIVLRLGAAGTVALNPEQRDAPPRALRSETWCASSRIWASVTPIVLDRLPPRSRKDYADWAAEQVCAACLRLGLPRPATVVVGPVSVFAGAPTCREVVPLPRRTDGGPRWHVHARIEFCAPVCGPVLLGAGRYRGYGICRPCHGGET